MSHSKINWSCKGFAYTGKVAAFERAIRAISSEPDIQLQPSGQGGVIVSENVGLIVELLLVEMVAQREPVVVYVPDDHLYQHSCGALIDAKEWFTLASVEQPMKSIITGETVMIPTQRCHCGSHISLAALKIVHARDVCNSRGSENSLN
jgi:hypothetical protein